VAVADFRNNLLEFYRFAFFNIKSYIYPKCQLNYTYLTNKLDYQFLKPDQHQLYLKSFGFNPSNNSESTKKFGIISTKN